VIDPGVSNIIYLGKVTPLQVKLAFAQFGHTKIELVQVVSGDSVHSKFIEKGMEGLNHLGFYVAKKERDLIIDKFTAAGNNVVMEVKSPIHSDGAKFVEIEKEGGLILELIDRAGWSPQAQKEG
jgi:hypothetical protein